MVQQTVDEETVENYLHDNYKKELLRSLKLNWALMYDIDGHLLYNRTAYLDPSNDTEVPRPAELLELPANITERMTNIESRVGGLLLEASTYRIIIFTASPVLTDDLSFAFFLFYSSFQLIHCLFTAGPSVGTLLFARYV